MEKDQAADQARGASPGNGSSAAVGHIRTGTDGTSFIVSASSQAQGARPEAFPRARQQADELPGLGKQEKRANWLIRLGHWWEGRRTVRRREFDQLAAILVAKRDEEKRSNMAVEVARLKVQVDRLELYVGLKREPKPVVVPGEARIS